MPSLVEAVIQVESGGDPNAISHVGAQGLMQLMPDTADMLGVEDPFDPQQNREGGTKYLEQLIQKYNGNLEHALKAYNWGPGNMDSYLKTGKGINGQPMPKETIDYYNKVIKIYKA